MEILYEDNHLLVVNKSPGEIVQGDKTGDVPLSESLKAYLKEKYLKPGNVFLGVPHRLDRPTSGIVVFARTGKALARLNDMFRKGEVSKTYHAIVPHMEAEGEIRLEHWLTRNEKQNKSYAHVHSVPEAKQALLTYHVAGQSDRYTLLEVRLLTGRHHQIRCQLAAEGHPIKGDLKYGAPRSNPDGSICLHARSVEFDHPVKHVKVSITAPYPDTPLWNAFAAKDESAPTKNQAE